MQQCIYQLQRLKVWTDHYQAEFYVGAITSVLRRFRTIRFAVHSKIVSTGSVDLSGFTPRYSSSFFVHPNRIPCRAFLFRIITAYHSPTGTTTILCHLPCIAKHYSV